MKKPILVVAAVCLVGLPGWAQISGCWEAELEILPAPALSYTELSLEYTLNGDWTFSSLTEFTESGFAGQRFGISGMLGPAFIEGTMAFNPSSDEQVTVSFPDGCGTQTASTTLASPAYMWTRGKAEWSLLGTTFIARTVHYAYPYAPNYEWPCCSPQTESYILFCLTAQSEYLSVTGMFEDCCTGLAFAGALLEVTDLSLCCDITHDLTLSFSKAGFEYLKFTASSLLPLCCGVTFDAEVKFTVNSKIASITPRWEGLGQACVSLFADVLWEEDSHLFEGIEIYGWKIRCELGDCAHLEMLTALDVAEVEEALAGDEEEDKPCEFSEESTQRPVFQGDEFEYIELGFCGPGCCGGRYTVDVAVFFQDAEPTLFGLSRLETEAKVPVMSNLELHTSFALDAVENDHTLSVGWYFTF